MNSLDGVQDSRDVRDDVDRPCCCICGKVLKGTDYVCLACKREWGLEKSYIGWPEWVRFLRQDEENRRYRLYKSLESKFEHIEFDDETVIPQ